MAVSCPIQRDYAYLEHGLMQTWAAKATSCLRQLALQLSGHGRGCFAAVVPQPPYKLHALDDTSFIYNSEYTSQEHLS